MGAVTDGMGITDYMENDRQEYLLMHYKVKDSFPNEKYWEMFRSLKEEGIIVNECYDDVSKGTTFHTT